MCFTRILKNSRKSIFSKPFFVSHGPPVLHPRWMIFDDHTSPRALDDFFTCGYINAMAVHSTLHITSGTKIFRIWTSRYLR